MHGTKYQAVITYKCDTGFDLLGNKSAVCNANGNWSHDPPTCKIKDCGDAKIPVNGTTDKMHGTKYQAVISYKCDTGFDLLGNKSAVCNANGNWSHDPPTCKIKDCGDAKIPVNGTIVTMHGTKYQAVITYKCDTGFDLLGNKSAVCNANGNWSHDPPTCKIKDCGDAKIPVNGTTDKMHGTKYQAVITYKCDTGFDLVGNETAVCNAYGNWNHDPPMCKIKDCGNAKIPVNGTTDETHGTKYQAVITYKCDTGFDLLGNETAICSAYGNWSHDPPTCKIKDCGNLTAPTNGFVNTPQGSTFGSRASYSCKTGYTLNANDTSVCDATGNWRNQNVNCTINDCSDPTTPGNGSFEKTNGTTYQAVITYNCNEGYNLTGATTAACQANKSWSAGPPKCVIRDCGDPGTPLNGTAEKQNGTKYQAVITYKCDTGFDIVGNVTAVCQSSETWSNDLPTCRIKDCGNLTAPTNGFVNTPQGSTFGSRASYSCKTGYSLYGNDTSVCEATGNWSNQTVRCTINDCSDPTPPGNGSFKKPNGTTYQAVITYVCNEGYNLTGSTTAVCQANKLWSAGPPKCVIRDCGDPGAPVNGSADTQNGTKYQAVITYECDTGFDVVGNGTAVCLSNETWSNDRPTCNIKDCGMPNQTTNGNVSLDSGQKTVYLQNATYVCKSGYETKDPTHVTCNASGLWSNPPPTCKDIDECKRYTAKCHKWANCTNTNGSYTCSCKKDFNDTSIINKGRQCEDIDECATANKCNRNGSLCVNYPGGFRCECNDGWTGEFCYEDINECNRSNACGSGAYCTDFDGGYNCTCEPSLPKGNPKVQCYENVIIQLETKVEPFRGDDQLIDAKPFQHRFPYFGEGYTSYRPYMNGFLALAYQPIYESYGPINATQWKDVTHGYTVIAPLWTNLDSTNLTGGLYVHYFDNYGMNYGNETTEHKDLEKIQKAFADYYNLTDFKVRLALVATWENVTMSSYIPTVKLIKTQNASMQVILISDGVYSYIMFNYDQEQWSLKIDPRIIPSSSGFSLADKTGFITATSSNFSQLNNGTNVHPELKGRWIYNVSSTDPSKTKVLKNESECLEFGQNSTIKKWLNDQRAKSNPCPCSEVQIEYDYSFTTVDPMYTNPDFTMTCYEEWFFNNGVKQRCCYRSGALEKDNIGGGFPTFEPDTKYHTIDYFYKCCDGDGHLCHIFYEMNPSDNCSRYNPSDEPINRKKRSLIGYLKIGSDSTLSPTVAPLRQRSDLECYSDSLAIQLPEGLFPAQRNITWRDDVCSVIHNGSHYISSILLTECGTTVLIENDTVTFSNELIVHKVEGENRVQVNIADRSITYGEDYETVIPVKCIYPRYDNVSTEYIPVKQNVRFYEKRYGELDIAMEQFENDQYDQALDTSSSPRKVPLNDDVFIRVGLNFEPNNVRVNTDQCIATSTPMPADKNWRSLITSGCPEDSVRLLSNENSSDVKFAFRAFDFRHSPSGFIYVHCEVSVCDDVDASCRMGCSARAKRSADGRRQRSHLVSTGPLFIEKKGKESKDMVTMPTVAVAASLLVAMAAVIVAIIGWTRKPRHNGTSI